MKKRLEFTGDSPKHKARKSQEYEGGYSNKIPQYSPAEGGAKKPVDKVASLHRAARRGHLESVMNLVKEGVDIEAKTAWGGTPLYIAVVNKHLNITKFLLKAGADPNKTTTLLDNPLNAAIGFVDTKLAELLIKNGADVEKVNLSGDRPLHTATRYGSPMLVKTLLAHGADIEAKAGDGQTALAIAIKNINMSLVKVLAWYGANITHQNTYDAIVINPSYDEDAIFELCSVGNIIDSLFYEEQSKEGMDIELCNTLSELSDHGQDLIFNRLLYQSFRNKALSIEEIKAISANLAAKIDYAITELHLIDFRFLKDFLEDFNQDIIMSSCQNEIGNIPSLFKLAIDILKKSGLSLVQIGKKTCQDIVDKAYALERVADFTSKLCLKLKAEVVETETANNAKIRYEVLSYNGNAHDDDTMTATGGLMEEVD